MVRPFHRSEGMQEHFASQTVQKLNHLKLHQYYQLLEKTNNGGLENVMENMQSYVTHNAHTSYQVESLNPSDSRTRSKLCLDAIENKNSSSLEIGSFGYAYRETLPANINIFGGRFV